ncbi:MAG: acyl-CoA desaturase [Cyanobacteria bacterium SZAS LIN-2]|nr:acyl-CoA desaturase [Cyanobacteria bacterium SZAS LIN-3]MBS1996204.1 acyl-CoA desaturase [Cyanobacteria bacterium SZAS LIN-2]MBS2007478.1 acyl-CoA desaturase [Cyanobacteria bacterium SZAS TMP-1]
MDNISLLYVFFGFVLWHGLGTSIGYHRLLSHRSLACRKWLEYFLVFGAIFGFQGSPIWWTSIHRSHHKHSDKEFDLHAPSQGFRFWNYDWFLQKTYPSFIIPKEQCVDLYKDPLYRFLECDGDWPKAQWLNFFWIAVVARMVLLPVLGWQGVLVSLLASVFFFQMPLVFNYVCHIPKYGYKSYKTTDDSVNVWWIGLIWFGEGWHNNHHAEPGTANMGRRPFEIDPSWIILKCLKAIGLVTRLDDSKKMPQERVPVAVTVK